MAGELLAKVGQVARYGYSEVLARDDERLLDPHRLCAELADRMRESYEAAGWVQEDGAEVIVSIVSDTALTFTTGAVKVCIETRVVPAVEPRCEHANHKAPDPVDGPTSCPCGLVTRHPAPPKENPRA